MVCFFALLRLAIVLSVLLRFTYSDYPFNVFKFFIISDTNYLIDCNVCSVHEEITSNRLLMTCDI